MSKFDLRDISERLTNSSDTEALVYEFLGYLQTLNTHWRASLAFYEVSHDALENVYERNGNQLVRRDVSLPVDKLPARLVRKFFHPSAFFNQASRRTILNQWNRSSPVYEVSQVEASSIRTLVPVANWQSCVCISLMDREDLLALLVIASEKKNVVSDKSVEPILPLKTIAALALAQHLDRAGRTPVERVANADIKAVTAEFQDRIRRLNAEALELEEDNRAKADKLEALSREVDQLDKNSSEYKQELARVKGGISALEEQSAIATQHLNEAFTQLNAAQRLAYELERTVNFMRNVCQMLSQQHDSREFARTTVSWLCQQFGVERCSLMTLDSSGETLRIAAQSGIDPEVASGIKVRVGQGIAGWVAHNRKPLFVRVQEEVPAVERTTKETYNSDSFICLPLVYGNHLYGVLSLSNKREGEPFEAIDLDRATMAGAVLAVLLAGQEMARDALMVRTAAGATRAAVA